MGGHGSGRPSRYPDTVNNTKGVDITYMRRAGLLVEGGAGTLNWSRNGQPTGNVQYRIEREKLILMYRFRFAGGDWQEVEQTILLQSTPCNYGGERWWLTCPKCARRCTVLYGASTLFYCRKCYKLPYQTQLEGHHGRACLKRNKIEEQLTKSTQKRIWKRTQDRLINKLEKAETEANLALAAHFKELYGELF